MSKNQRPLGLRCKWFLLMVAFFLGLMPSKAATLTLDQPFAPEDYYSYYWQAPSDGSLTLTFASTASMSNNYNRAWLYTAVMDMTKLDAVSATSSNGTASGTASDGFTIYTDFTELVYTVTAGQAYCIFTDLANQPEITATFKSSGGGGGGDKIVSDFEFDKQLSITAGKTGSIYFPESGTLTMRYISGDYEFDIVHVASPSGSTLSPSKTSYWGDVYAEYSVVGGVTYYFEWPSTSLLGQAGPWTVEFSFVSANAPVDVKFVSADPAPGSAFDPQAYESTFDVVFSPSDATFSGMSFVYTNNSGQEITVNNVECDLGGGVYRPLRPLFIGSNGKRVSDPSNSVSSQIKDGSQVKYVFNKVNYNGSNILSSSEIQSDYVQIAEDGTLTLIYKTQAASTLVSQNLPEVFYQDYGSVTPPVGTLTFSDDISAVGEVTLIQGKKSAGQTPGENDASVTVPASNVTFSGPTVSIDFADVNIAGLPTGNVTLYVASVTDASGLQAKMDGQTSLFYHATVAAQAPQPSQPAEFESLIPENNTTVEPLDGSITFTVNFTENVKIEKATYGQRGDGALQPVAAGQSTGEYAKSWQFTIPAFYINRQIWGGDPDYDSVNIIAHIYAVDEAGEYVSNNPLADDISICYFVASEEWGAPINVTMDTEAENSLDTFTVIFDTLYFSDVTANDDNSYWDGSNLVNQFKAITVTGEGFTANAESFENNVVTFSPAITKSGSYTINVPYHAFTVNEASSELGGQGSEAGNTYWSAATSGTFEVTIENESEQPTPSGEQLELNDNEFYPQNGVKYYYTPASNGTLKWEIVSGKQYLMKPFGLYTADGVEVTATKTDLEGNIWGNPDMYQGSYAEFELTADTQYYFMWGKNDGSNEYACLFTFTGSAADDFDITKYTVTPDTEEPVKEFYGATVTWGEYPVEIVDLSNIYYNDPEWGDKQTAEYGYLTVSTPDNSLVIDVPFNPITNTTTTDLSLVITLGKGSIKVNGELLDQDIKITYVLLPSGVTIPDPVSDPQKGMGHTSSLKTITITYPGFLMGGGMDLDFFGYDVTKIGGGARLYIGNNPYFVGANDSDYQEVSGITSKGVGASKQVSGRTWYESIEFTLPESYNDPKMWYTFLLNTGKLALLSEDNDIIEVSEEVVLSYQVADIVTVPAKFQQLEYDNYQGLLIKGDNLSVADASKVELYQMSFEALTSSGNAPADATLLGTGVEATNGEGILITVPDADLFTGGYTFVVRSGAINGVSQRVIPFSIVGRDMTIDNVKVTAEPEEGEVEEIESIKVYWGEEMPLSPRSGSVNATLNGANIEFNVVSVDGDIDGVYTSYLEYTPAQPITAAGTYNVVIPAGAVQVKLNSEYVSSNEVSLTYTIAASTLELPVPGTLAPPVQNEKYYYTPEEDCVIKIESKNKISFRNPYLNFFYTEDGTPVALKDSDIEASNTYGSGTWATYQLTGGQTYYFMSVRDGVDNEDSFSFSIVSEGGDEPGEVPAVYLAHSTSWQAMAPADDDLELTYDETSGMYKGAFDITEGGIYYAFYSKNSDGTYTNYGPANPTATWGNNADFTFTSYGQTFTEYVKALSCGYDDWGMFRVLNNGLVKGNLLVTLDIPGNQMTATLNEEGTPEPGIEALYVAFGNTIPSVAPGANDPVLALQADGTYKGTFEYNLEGDKYFTVYSTTNGVNTYYATFCQSANDYEPITFRSGNPWTNNNFATTENIAMADKFYVFGNDFEGSKVFNLTVTVDMDKAPNWTVLASVLPSTSENVSFTFAPTGAYSDVTLKVNDAEVTLESDAYDYDGTYPGKVYFSVPDTKKITVTCNEDLVAGDDTYSIMEMGTTEVQVDLYEGAKGATFTVSVMDADAELPAAFIIAPLPNVDRVTSIIVGWGGTSDFDENEVTKGSMQGMLTLPTGEEVNISNKAKLNQQWGIDGEGKVLGDYYNSLLFQNLNLDFDSPFMGYDIQGTYTLNLPAGCVYVNGIPSEAVTLTFTVGEEVDYLTYAESIPESGTFVSALPFVALTWGEDVELVEEEASVEVRINGEVKGNAPVDILPSLVDGGIFSDGSAADYSCAVVDLGDFVDWNTTGVVTFTLPEGIVKNGEGAINRLQNFEYTVLAPSYADTWTPDPTETTSISNTKTISVSWGDATIEFNELATSNAVTALNEQTKQEVYFSEGNGLTFEDKAIVLDLSLIEEAGQYTFTVPANFVFVGSDKINVETMATYNVTIGEEELKYFEGEVTIMDPETTIVASIGSVSVMWDMYYELTLTEGVKAQLYVSDSLNELGELVLDDVDLAVVNVTPQQEPGMEQIYPSDTWNLINGVVLSPDVFAIWGKTGTFTFVIPAGAVKNQEGLYNSRTEVVLHVVPLYNGNAVITPECENYGEPTKVKTLPDITITFDNVTNISLNEPCDIRVNIDGVHTTVSTDEYMTPIYDESDGSIVGYKFDINELTKDWEGQVEFILPEGAFIIETTDGGMYLNNEGNYTFITTESTGIANIVDAQDGKYVVYNMNGVLLLNTENAADLQLLQPGLYIINGKKLIIRK